jgi:predicted Zn-dependent peptidase
VSAETLEREVARELDQLHRGGVAEDEVRRATALIATDLVASMQSASERADQLSKFATYFGDPSLINEQAARYAAVTAEQVSAVARERLGPENRASLLYVPKDAEDGTRDADAASDASDPQREAATAAATGVVA